MRPLVFDGSFTVRTDAQLRAAIEGAAARDGSTASTWVRRALKQAVEQGHHHKGPRCSLGSRTDLGRL